MFSFMNPGKSKPAKKGLKIIIVGCGKVGTTLVEQLSKEGHDIITVSYTHLFALASGGTVVCSHYLGCKSKDHAKEAARQLVFVTLMLSLIIGAICLVFNQQILNLIFGKVEKDVMAGAKQYFFYSVLSLSLIHI